MASYNPFSLEGKSLLITGASSGIGRSIAIECSKMGANVIITGRNEERLYNTFKNLSQGNHRYIKADISTEDGIKEVVDNCIELDGIVHSAGIADKTPLSLVREKNISKVMSINFNAPVLLQRSLLKKKLVKDGASIVFIASRAPFAPAVGNGIYAASKGALLAYSKVLGLELSSRNIRVNSICPAVVWTELTKTEEDNLGLDYHEIELQYPLKRFGQPQDVAYLAIYMLSDASNWMTGSCVDITGGSEFTLK